MKRSGSTKSPDMWSALNSIQEQCGIRPEIEDESLGFTIEEYQKRYRTGHERAQKQLNGLVKSGKLRIIGVRRRYFVYDVVK